MFRTENPSVADGEVSVQKVKKIEHVYDTDLVTRPSVYANLTTVTVVAKPVADVAVSDQKMFRRLLEGVPSKKDIDDYITRKKLECVNPDT